MCTLPACSVTEVALSTAVHLAQGRRGGPGVPQSEEIPVPGEDSVLQRNLSEGPLKRVVVTNTARSAPKYTCPHAEIEEMNKLLGKS